MGDSDTDFVVWESRRQAALRELESQLLSFFAGSTTRDLPLRALPCLAALTFADGAAYLVAEDDGHLSVLGPTASPENAISAEGLRSPFWDACRQRTPVLWSHMSESDTARNGLAIQGGGSLMIEPACSFVRSIQHTSACVWRSHLSNQKLSSQAFQAWDAEAFRRAINVLILVGEASRSVEARTNAEAVTRSLTALLNVVQPQLVVMADLIKGVPEPFSLKISKELCVLEDQILEMQRYLR